jgi:hypothetical protein
VFHVKHFRSVNLAALRPPAAVFHRIKRTLAPIAREPPAQRSPTEAASGPGSCIDDVKDRAARKTAGPHHPW